MKIRFYLIAAAIAAVLLHPLAFAQSSTNPQAVSLYNLGFTAYKRGSPESAIIFFKRAIDIDPDFSDAQYNLGLIYQTERRYREAIPCLENVLRTKPNDPDAHYQLGVMLQEMGRLQEARQHLSNIAPNNSHFADVQNRLTALNTQLASTQNSDPQNYSQGAPNNQQNTNSVQNAPVYSFGNPLSPTGSTMSPPAVTNQAVFTANVPPPAVNNQMSAAPGNFAASTAVQTPTGQPAAQTSGSASAAPSTPTATLANTTLQVVATGFSAPAGLAFDRIGNLYVANFLSSTIDRINTDGTRSRFSSGANIKGPIGLAVDGNGYVYVANYNNGTVARVSPAGIATIIATGLRKPYYLALDHEGNLFVSQQEDNSIVKISLPRAIGVKL